MLAFVHDMLYEDGESFRLFLGVGVEFNMEIWTLRHVGVRSSASTELQWSPVKGAKQTYTTLYVVGYFNFKKLVLIR